MNEKFTKKNLRSRTDIKKLQSEIDHEIHDNDNPATTEDFWKDADVFMPQKKIPVSLRLDQDIIEYFKEEGSRYQSRINAVLKAYIHSHPHHRKR